MTNWPLDELIPHRPPMRLIDEVESFDAERKRLVARVTISDRQLFFSEGGVPSWAAIEYMAQTAAALVGCYDKHVSPGRSARPGLLLGARKMALDLDRFEDGKTYRVTAENEFCDSDAAAFACEIEDEDGKVVATANLNAYRPPDFTDFLKEQVKA